MDTKTKEKLLNQLQKHSWKILFDADHAPILTPFARGDWRVANGLLYTGTDSVDIYGVLGVGGEFEIVVDPSVTGAEITVLRNDDPYNLPEIRGTKIIILKDGSLSILRSMDNESVDVSPKTIDVSRPLIISIFVLMREVFDPAYITVKINGSVIAEFKDDLIWGYLSLNGGIYYSIKHRPLFISEEEKKSYLRET